MPAQIASILTSWLRLRLARERQGSHQASAGAQPCEWPELAAELAAIPTDALLAEIRRQRLISVLAPDLAWLDTQPRLAQLAARLRRLHQRESQAALVLQHLTIQAVRLFEQAGLPVLVLKGIPLALQTTDCAIARGRGDLDLLVAANCLPEAVALLEQKGFDRVFGQFPMNLRSFWGRYSRWAGYELPLRRMGRAGAECIDLHWSLAPVRAPLPGFDQLWRRRAQLKLQGQSLSTLGIEDALLFAAAHAAKDDWHSLRHLVDLDRLARRLPVSSQVLLRRQRLVRRSAGVAHALTGSPELLALCHPRDRGLEQALAVSRRAQAQPAPPQPSGDPWNLGRWLARSARSAGLSRHPIDWLRVALSLTLLPAAFNDPLTGADRSLVGMLQARWQRWGERRSQTISGSWPASSRSAPGP